MVSESPQLSLEVLCQSVKKALIRQDLSMETVFLIVSLEWFLADLITTIPMVLTTSKMFGLKTNLGMTIYQKLK